MVIYYILIIMLRWGCCYLQRKGRRMIIILQRRNMLMIVFQKCPAIPDVSGFATTEYVDTEISNLGDLLVFKGTIDFTTTPAPTEFATGSCLCKQYVAGTPDPSWGSDQVMYLSVIYMVVERINGVLLDQHKVRLVTS